ncbi:hypothetical protein UACE39S_00678 [Ureibacillus acetophenoni]
MLWDMDVANKLGGTERLSQVVPEGGTERLSPVSLRLGQKDCPQCPTTV